MFLKIASVRAFGVARAVCVVSNGTITTGNPHSNTMDAASGSHKILNSATGDRLPIPIAGERCNVIIKRIQLSAMLIAGERCNVIIKRRQRKRCHWRPIVANANGWGTPGRRPIMLRIRAAIGCWMYYKRLLV